MVAEVIGRSVPVSVIRGSRVLEVEVVPAELSC
jgi:hypothetical protein